MKTLNTTTIKTASSSFSNILLNAKSQIEIKSPNIQHLTSNIFLFAAMLFSLSSFSQAHVTMSLKNITATSNTIEYDLYIVNDGNTALKLSACSYGVNFNEAILNGGTISSSYLNDSKAEGLKGLTAFANATTKTNEINQARMTSTPSGFEKASTLIPEVPFKVGRFVLKNTTAWTKNSNASFSLQEASKIGLTSTQIVGYVGSDKNLVALTPTLTTVATYVENGPVLNPSKETAITNTQAQIEGPSNQHSLMLKEGNIKVYPNPTTDVLKIDVSTNGKSNITVSITDMRGHLVKRVLATVEEGINKLNIGVNELANGMYTIKVVDTKDINFSQTFSKQ